MSVKPKFAPSTHFEGIVSVGSDQKHSLLKNTAVHAPSHQLVGVPSQRRYRTIIMNPAPNGAEHRTSGAQMQIRVEPGSLQKWKNKWIRFKMDVANAAVEFAPCQYWWSKYTISTQGGAKSDQWSGFHDTVYLGPLLTASEGQKCQFAFLGQGNADTLQANKTQQVGSEYYHMPLSCLLDQTNPWLTQAAIKDPIILTLYSSNQAVVSGTASNSTLSEVALIVCEEWHPEPYATQAVAQLNKAVQSRNFIDWQRVQETKTLADNTDCDISLQGFNGKCIGLLAVMRSADSAAQWVNYQDIGQDSGATLDLIGPTGDSLYCNNNALPADFFRYGIPYNSSQGCNDLPVYWMPFSNHIHGSLEQGTLDGFVEFDGSRYLLRIHPQVATDEVWTVAATGAVDAGSYRYLVNGEPTTELAHGADGATQAAAIQSTNYCTSRGITVTVSGALENAVTITVNGGKSIPSLSVVPMVDLGTNSALDLSVTTHARRGPDAGSHSISVYAAMLKNCAYSPNGVISVTNV